MVALQAAHQSGQIARDPQGQPDAWCQRQRQLYQHPWVVYAKTPLGGPAQVLDYLGRYTHRTAIGNERIKGMTKDEVAFTVRANDAGGKRKLRLPGTTFIGRFLLHVLPTGIKRIRHYGVLACASKGVKLMQAQTALHMPAFNPGARESAHDFIVRVAKIDAMRCPCCGKRMQVVAQLRGLQHLPTPASTGMPSNRGPP
jgi:hypothetical protein